MPERGECSKSSSAAVPEEPAGSVVNVEDRLTALEAGAATSRSATVAGVDAVPELDTGSSALHQALAKGLHLAAAARNDKMLDMLLDLHPNVNSQDDHEVRTTPQNGLDPKIFNTQGERRRTPLNTYAGSQGASLHIIKKFLKEGADPNVPDEYGRTCLHTATYVGNVLMVRHLLNPEIYSNCKVLVDINALANGGLTALHIAAKYGRENVLRELLNHSPDVNLIGAVWGSTALHLFLSEKRGSEELSIVRKFLELGVDLGIVDAKKRNVLHVAVLENKADVVKYLLDSDLAVGNPEKSLDINAVDKYGLTALHLAAEGSNCDVLETILDREPDLNIRDVKGNTAFDICLRNAKSKGTRALKLFLWHGGVNPSLGNKPGIRLHAAVYPRLYPRLIECLLDVSNYSQPQYRLDPNELDETGLTPLHLTVGFSSKWHGYRVTTLMAMSDLLKHGADPNIRTQLGWSAVKTTVNMYKWTPPEIKTVRYADEESGVRLGTRDEGLTALHIAVVNGFKDGVKVLLENGADVDAQDNLGMTALMLFIASLGDQDRYGYYLATESGENVVGLLLEHRARVSITGPQGQNCVHIAATRGLSSILKDILEASNRLGEVSIISSIDGYGATALHHAVNGGYEDAVEVLLSHNADVNVRDNWGMSPFMQYLSRGSAATGIVGKFLERGASVGMTGPEGQNCLHIAAAKGLSSILKDILEASNRLGELSIISSIDHEGATALHHASEEGNDDAVEVLLNHNADVNVQNNRGMSPLMLYVRNSAVTGRLLPKFFERGGDFNVLDHDMKKQNLLHVAARSGNCAVVKALLGSKDVISSSVEELFKVDSVDEDGSTALHLAADENHDVVLLELLDHDPDVNIRDKRGNTPLIRYCRNRSSRGSLDMVEEFIKHGAKLETLNEEKQGCLHAAVESDVHFLSYRFLDEAHVHAAEFVSGLVELLVRGEVEEVVGVNAIDVHGMTPLHLAAASGKGGVLRRLLNNNAQVNLQDSRGKTSLHYYLQSGPGRYSEMATGVVERFLEVGANPSILDENGHNCLHAAVMSRRCHSVELLMEACSKFRCAVDVDAADNQGCTALHLALATPDSWGIKDMVERLLGYNPSLIIRNKRGETPLEVYQKAGGHSNFEVVEMLEQLGAKEEVDDLLPEKYEEDPVSRNEVGDETSVDGQEELSSDDDTSVDGHEELSSDEETSVDGQEKLSSDEDPSRRVKQRKRTVRLMPFQTRTGAIPLLRSHPHSGTEPHRIPVSSEEEPDPEDALDTEDPEWTLRSDALALGFQGFDDPFDRARVLCIVVKSADQTEISFFHHEGMALFFGVGLRFSKVLLRGLSIDGSVEVQELESTTWMERWSNNQMGSLVVYNRKQGIEGFFQALRSTAGGDKDSLLSSNNQPLPILGDLHNYLVPFPSALSAGISSMTGSNGSSTSETLRTISNAHPMARFAVQGETHDSLVEGKSGEFELTVIVRLNSQDCTTDNTEGVPREIKKHEPELKKLFMKPVLTIRFEYLNDGGLIRKTFHTTLSLQFHMDTNSEISYDPMGPKFDWFHNYSGMSFHCSDIDAEGLESNVKLNVEPRIVEQVHGGDHSSSEQSGVGKGVIGITASNEQAITMSESRQETESTKRSYLLETHRDSAKLACLVSLADSYDERNPEHWKGIWSSGGVETVPLLAEGQWEVDNSAKNPCEYHFTVKRNLYMVQTRRTPKILQYLFRKKNITRRTETLIVTQQIATTLYIDHSFSFVERLALKKRSHIRLALGLSPTAPAEACDVIDTVDKISCSSSSTLSTSPATAPSSSSYADIL